MVFCCRYPGASETIGNPLNKDPSHVPQSRPSIGLELARSMRSSSPDSSLMRFSIGDVAKRKVVAGDRSNVGVRLLDDSVVLVKNEFNLWRRKRYSRTNGCDDPMLGYIHRSDRHHNKSGPTGDT